MRVITESPIELKSACCGFSGIDGSNKESVRLFQVWASINHGAQLVADGIYGPLTKAAYAKWGAEWEKTQPKRKDNAQTSKSKVAAVSKQLIDVDKNPKEEAKVLPVIPVKKTLKEKMKALPLSAKIGIGVGVLLIVGFVTWKLLPKKKK